jgi:branched-chain amino acid transport system ATP-binding protein
MTTELVLDVRALTGRYGRREVFHEVSVDVQSGQALGVVGPNGAGKTTLVNLVTGFTPQTAGSVIFEGTDITRLRSHEIARRGVSRTFQIVQPFAEMSVLENVMAGALFAGHRSTIADASQQSMHYLEFVGLALFADTPASQLSLANRKRLELAKSLAMRPRLLFLDEVNAGLNSSEIENALELIRKIAATGITIVIIEHVLRVILSLVKRLVVLHQGALLTDGAPSAVLNEPAVVKAYLGTKFAKRHQAQFNAPLNKN